MTLAHIVNVDETSLDMLQNLSRFQPTERPVVS